MVNIAKKDEIEKLCRIFSRCILRSFVSTSKHVINFIYSETEAELSGPAPLFPGLSSPCGSERDPGNEPESTMDGSRELRICLRLDFQPLWWQPDFKNGWKSSLGKCMQLEILSTNIRRTVSPSVKRIHSLSFVVTELQIVRHRKQKDLSFDFFFFWSQKVRARTWDVKL